MSEAHELVARIYGRWNSQVGDLAADLFDPEVVIHQMSRMFDSEGTFHGHEGLIRSSLEFTQVWQEITWKPEEWIELGEIVVVPLTVTGVAVLSRIKADTRLAHLWRVEGGLVKEFSVYETKEAALRAAEVEGRPEADRPGT